MKKRYFLFFLILFWGILSQSELWAKPAGFSFRYNAKSVKIPVEIQNNIILIPVRINNSFEMNFILDTGVRTTILTETVISDFLSLDSLTSIRVRGLGEGGAIEAALARDISISLPGIDGTGQRLIILPEGVISYSGLFGKPVYGIIGYEVFRQFVVEINYTQKYVRLHDPFRYKPKKKSVAIPIEIKRSKPYVSATLTDYRGEKINSQWLVDTGASQAISLFDDDLPVPEVSVDAFLGMGLSGGVFGKLGRVQSFAIGDFNFSDVIAGYPNAESLNMVSGQGNWYGNLGAEIMSRFHVVFDYPNKTLYLRKNSAFKKAFKYNISGIEVITAGEGFDQYVISYVRPGSPAEVAGVKIKDQILSVNGISADKLNIDELYATVGYRNRKIIVLRIKRGGEYMRFKFRLQSEI